MTKILVDKTVIERVLEALVVAEEFVDRHSEDWYISVQKDLKQIREAITDLREALAEQAEQEPVAIEELAWEKYCEDTAGDMDVRDFWEELPKSVQQQYIAKVSCSYPNCNCPFDHPGGDWCAKGLSTNATPVRTKDLTDAVDAAMVEMQNIHPPLRRSECERLIRAANYAAPVRTKDLTDIDLWKLWEKSESNIDFARAVIAAYKEKNQ